MKEMKGHLNSEKGKSQPKGESGASVASGLSMHQKFDADMVRSAGPEANMEQARCERKITSDGGFKFDGNSGA